MKTLAVKLRHRLPLLAFLLAAVLHAETEPVYHSPQELAFAPDGKTLAVADRTGKAIALVQTAPTGVLRSVDLGAPAAGLVWSADGKKIFASATGAGHIAEMDPGSGSITRRFSTGRHPHGLALAPRRDLLLACDWGLNRLTILNLKDGAALTHIPVGRQPTMVAVSPDESLAVVSNLLPSSAATAPNHATDITVVDLEKLSVRATVRLPTGSTTARAIAIAPDGKKAYVVHTLGRVHLPTTQLDRGWVNTNAFSIIDLTTSTRSATILLDQVMEGAADPWGLAIAPDGKSLFITLAGVHQLAVIDLHGLTALLGPDPDAFTNDLAVLHRERLIRRLDLPAKGPRGIHLSRDGRMLAVAGYFSGNVVLMDTKSLEPVSVPLGTPVKPDETRRGEIAYHDANRCFQRWLSCATCHADARVDGLNWDNLNDGIGNPKNARSMLLAHATPPMMSLGVRADMPTAVRKGFIHGQFTEPEDGEVEAVAAYLRSLQPATSPYRNPDGSLTESAARGEKIFHRESVGCARCHPAPLFTNLKLKDVGTATPRDGGRTEYDVPTLVELWRTGPYLHDGRAATLREVLVDHNPDDDHGDVSSLAPTEIDDLVAYLLSL